MTVINGQNPLNYLGVAASFPPNVTLNLVAPSTALLSGYTIGDIWVNTVAETAYILVSQANGLSTWDQIGAGATIVATINGLAPVAGNIIIAGTGGIGVTNAGNTVTETVINDGYTIVNQATAAAALVAQSKYNTNDGAVLVTYTLPAVATVGQSFAILGNSVGGWTVAQNAGQTIHFNAQNTTAGVTGSLSSSNRYNCVKLTCITANTDFVVETYSGTLTVV